jgi:EmrB/QacA subfamily drug resistance transporter
MSSSSVTSSTPDAPGSELPRRVIIASMTGVVAVMLLAALDATIVGTAMPRVIADLHGFEQYAAVTTVYMLAATVVVPIAGKLSDMYGRKPFLLGGTAIFVLGSALCGAATSMTGLIVARGIQGLGGGISQGMAFTTIADLFPPSRRGRVSGLMGAVFGVASVIGPAVGGFLTDGPGWRWCFYINIPVGIAALAVMFFSFPHIVADPGSQKRVDWLGAATLVLGVVPLLLALSWGGRDYPWSSPLIVALFAVGLVMTAVFGLVQTRAAEPIIPPSLFHNRIVWTASAATTLMSLGMFGTTLFIPLFLQGVIGRSATESGAVVTPMMLSLIGASIVSGQLMTRTGRYKVLGVFGVCAMTLGMFLLAGMDASTAYTTVLVNVTVVGVGLGVTMPVYNLAVQNAVDVRQIGVATSSVQFLRSIGGSVGAAIFGAVLSNRFVSVFHQSLPAAAASVIPPGMMATFENPQALMDPRIAGQVEAASPETVAQLGSILGAVKTALTVSLHDVFLFGAVLVACGVIFALLVDDIPLRTTNRRAVEPVEVM